MPLGALKQSFPIYNWHKPSWHLPSTAPRRAQPHIFRRAHEYKFAALGTPHNTTGLQPVAALPSTDASSVTGQATATPQLQEPSGLLSRPSSQLGGATARTHGGRARRKPADARRPSSQLARGGATTNTGQATATPQLQARAKTQEQEPRARSQEQATTQHITHQHTPAGGGFQPRQVVSTHSNQPRRCPAYPQDRDARPFVSSRKNEVSDSCCKGTPCKSSESEEYMMMI